MRKAILKRYIDGVSMKLLNKRVSIVKLDDGYGLNFYIYSLDSTPRSKHIRIRDKVTCTTIKLSEEAIAALGICINEVLSIQNKEPLKK